MPVPAAFVAKGCVTRAPLYKARTAPSFGTRALRSATPTTPADAVIASVAQRSEMRGS